MSTTRGITDNRYVRGHILEALYLHDKANKGDPLEYGILKRVIVSAHPDLDEKAVKGNLSFLQDQRLIEEVIDDDLPLELQEISAGVRLTRTGRAVVEGDAEAQGVKIAKR